MTHSPIARTSLQSQEKELKNEKVSSVYRTAVSLLVFLFLYCLCASFLSFSFFFFLEIHSFIPTLLRGSDDVGHGTTRWDACSDATSCTLLHFSC